MARKKNKKDEKFTKKEFNKNIRKRIAGALADFREELGEKEFEIRIKKASKLFSRGVKKTTIALNSETEIEAPVNAVELETVENNKP